jgi:Secretion system C-terminal sorting domain
MKKNLLLLICSVMSATVSAQWNWNPDPTINNPVCTASNTTGKNSIVSVPDAAGGSYIVWEDNRTSATTATDIYLQHLDPFGNQLLPSAGLPICTADSNQTNVVMTADGLGGVIIAWQDNRVSNSFGDIYMQKVNAAGAIQWTANGIPAINTSANQISPVITIVSLTEFIIVWRDGRNGTIDLYANKYSSLTGIKQWATDAEIVNQPLTQQRQQVFPDQLGGFFCIWEDQRISSAETDLFMQRVDGTGAVLWAANGVNICNAGFNQLNPQITSDGGTGIVATWTDNRISASDQNIYAQRIDATGAVQWAANGVVVCSATGNQNNPFIVPVGSGNTIITWGDNRVSTSDRNIYAQKLDNAGAVQWAANGVAICTALFNQPNATTSLTIVPDNSNGAIITWDDNRANNTTTGLDIYAQKITSAGTVAWTANGVNIATRTGSNQRTTAIVPDNANGAIIAWLDGRSGTANSEIHASHLFPDGTIPVVFSSIGAQKISSAIKVSWGISTEINTSHYELERSTDGVRFEKIASITARNRNAAQQYDYTDQQPAQGVNYYRIAGVDFDGKRKYSTVVKVNMNGGGKPQLTAFPLPAKDVVTVRLEGAAANTNMIAVTDNSGRILLKRSFVATGSTTQFDLNISNLANGSYIIQWRDSGGNIVAVQKLQKL